MSVVTCDLRILVDTLTTKYILVFLKKAVINFARFVHYVLSSCNYLWLAVDSSQIYHTDFMSQGLSMVGAR